MQGYWNTQLKFSDFLPDFGTLLDRMASESAEVEAREEFLRASYGHDPRQWVEWIRGSGPTNVLPVILHGGYWRALEAETHRFMLPAFKELGCAVANVEYRLMPHVRLADVVSDVVAALQLLTQQFPNAQLILIGHSAGAHLALSALKNPEIKNRTKGVIAISGVYDLAPVALSFLQAEINLTQDEIAAFSLAPEPTRPPVIYVNGSDETHEYLRGGSLMAKSENAQWHVIEGANHMTLTWATCAESTSLFATLFELEHCNDS